MEAMVAPAGSGSLPVWGRLVIVICLMLFAAGLLIAACRRSFQED